MQEVSDHLPYFNLIVAVGLAAGLAVFDALNRRSSASAQVRHAADRSVFLLIPLCLSGLVGSVTTSSLLEGRWPFEFPWSFTFYGGVLGAAFGFAGCVPLFRLAALPTADHLVTGLSLGHGIGRIGCYVGGCCFGRSCGACEGWSWLPLFAGRIPVQLLEAACEFANFAILLWLLLRRSPRPGVVTSVWLILYAIERFMLEFLRDDVRGSLPIASWFGLSPSQAIALGCLVVGGFLFMAVIRRETQPLDVDGVDQTSRPT